jgi:Flp pilus assembly protein TadD
VVKSAASPPAWYRRSLYWGWALIAAVTILAYLPTLRNGFVWDDDAFLTDNKIIKAPDGLRLFWLTKEPQDYWPMTSTTLWCEWRLWGLHAPGYHATNLLLHLAEAALLWAILRRLRVPGALLAALLFAAHPVNVESVAWIAQRKNLMAMLFYLLSIYYFLRTSWWEPGDDPAPSPRADRIAYALSLLSFLLAMLSKGSVAMLPLVFVGLLWWRRGLGRRDWLRLAPFFVVAAGLAVVNVWFQAHGSKTDLRPAGFEERLLAAGGIVWFYLGKALWPLHLIFVYPQWRVSVSDWRWWVPLIGVAAVTVLLGVKARFWLPGARLRSPEASYGVANSASGRIWWREGFFAWVYFCVMLIPVMGFTDIVFMIRYSLVADHYQHLAIIAVVALAAAALTRLAARWPRELGVLLGGLLIGTLTLLSAEQSSMYRNSETLYETTIARNPDCWLAYNNLAIILVKANRIAEAETTFREALRLKPDDANNENNLGTALVRLGRTQEAIPEYEKGVRVQPDYPEVRFDLALALYQTGRTQEAIAQFQEVIRLKPKSAAAYFGLALALRQAGREQEAVAAHDEGNRLFKTEGPPAPTPPP